MDIDPQGRDRAIRTIMGEVDPGDGDPGRAAVAAVILNRLRSGRFGDSVSDVVLQRNAFEPWSSRRRELEGYSPNSSTYKQAGRVFDAIANGEIDDPTGGATHFYSPAGQRALGRQPPDWGRGQPMVRIGGHDFYAPEGRVAPPDAAAAIRKALGEPAAGPALAFGPDASGAPTVPKPAPAGSLFRDAGFQVGPAPAAAPAPAASTPEAPPAGSLFRDAGFSTPTQPGAPAAASPVPGGDIPEWARTKGATGTVQIGDASYPVDAGGKVVTSPNINPQGFGPKSPLAIAGEIVTGLPGDVVGSIGEHLSAGNALTASGVADIKGGNYLPMMPSVDPKTWTAGGYLKTAAGMAGSVLSPLSGAITAGVEHPITALTGNPQAGEVVGMALGAGLPVAALARPTIRAVQNTIPANRAINALVEAIGPENVPGVINRLAGNPRLTLMDASDPVRTMAQGLIDPAQPQAQRLISDAVTHRADTAAEAVNHAYTAAMGPAPDTVKMVQGLRQKAIDVGRNVIDPALASARPVDTSSVITAIDRELKPGITGVASPGSNVTPSHLQQELMRVRDRLIDENGNTVVDPFRLHEIQSDLRRRAYELSNSATGSDRLLGRDLYDFRNRLVGAIDDATGGAYRPGLERYRDAMQVDEAFDAGFDTLKNRPGRAGLEDRPEAFKQWMDNATDEEIVARRLGTRADIDQKINGMRNAARQGTSITDIEYNRQKLEMLFGKEEAGRLIQLMHDERDIARTNARVVAQSKTAETHAAQEALKIRDVGPLFQGGAGLLPPAAAEVASMYAGGIPGVATTALLGLGAARKGAQKLGQMSNTARNVGIARAASALGSDRLPVLDQLYRHHAVQRALMPPRATYSQEFMNALRAAGQLLIAP